MPFLRFQDSVVVPKTVIIAAAAINAATVVGIQEELLVTSGNDSVHMVGSKHYTDEALDFRTKTLTTAEKHALAVTVRGRLGRNYDVILESEGQPSEHLHIEHDPKRQ